MEGILWKWTNMWNGWQTRWFILENDVLSYYKSQEEVKQGCKGSIKVHACEIIVSDIDMTRMDLVIPGEQHLYLRAATPQERQQWLVALGSAKACVNKDYNIAIPSNNTLKSKKSELRLYCDLLMQQVHMVKTVANSKEDPQIQKLDEATNLLSATCDTFIKTLEECMKLANANVMFTLPSYGDSPLSPIPPTQKKFSINLDVNMCKGFLLIESYSRNADVKVLSVQNTLLTEGISKVLFLIEATEQAAPYKFGFINQDGLENVFLLLDPEVVVTQIQTPETLELRCNILSTFLSLDTDSGNCEVKDAEVLDLQENVEYFAQGTIDYNSLYKRMY